jgi:hypothetical protein
MNKIKRPIEAIASDLKLALTREASNVIAIGDLLLEAREAVDHGDWVAWLAANFGSSRKTSYNYMCAANFAAKWVTVTHLKLRPTALYLLGSHLDDGPDDLFSPEAIEAILKVAESEWVNDERAHAIAKSFVQPLENDEQEERGYTDEEIKDMLDGPPPVLPQPPPPVPVSSVRLDELLEMMARLQTKPLAEFFGITHTPDQLHAAAAFLDALGSAMTKRKAA